MDDFPKKTEYSMSREDLRNVLYEWLKDKGILGELQAFIQQKMVEKLSLKGLITQSDTKPIDVDEEMLRLLVFDYLHHRKLFYTISVLKVESMGSDYSNPSALKTVKRGLVRNLKVNDPLRNILLSAPDNTTILENLLDNYRMENNWKENDLKGASGKFSSPKLGINIQTQTASGILETEHSELERNMKLSMQENNAFSNDVMPLKLQSEPYPTTLQGQTETSACADVSAHHASSSTKKMYSNIIQETKSTCIEDYNTSEETVLNGAPLYAHAKRIEKAQRYLNVLDSRLSNISRRYERALNFQVL